jgi:perosamine synthetase
MTSIPITRPWFDERELEALRRPLESGWIVQGPCVAEFESRFASFVHSPHAVACSNGTTALHLAYAALGLAAGDEVIVPAFTWIATPNAAVYCGARPVFCDIDLATFNIVPDRIEELVTERTRGIVAVHLFGLCAEMNPILQIAERHGLWVVEDAACAFGATYEDRFAGTLGAMAAFSFHPRKSITTGEGGMVTTRSDALASRVRSMRDHGAAARRGEPAFLLTDYDELGFNYRMTDLQGAIGCVQIERAEEILRRRRQIAKVYDHALASIPWLRPPVVADNMQHAYQAYVCLFAPEEPTLANVDVLGARRNALMAALESRGIATRQGTHAPVRTAFYQDRFGVDPEHFPQAVIAERLSLALPLFPQMTEEEQDRVIRALREVDPC